MSADVCSYTLFGFDPYRETTASLRTPFSSHKPGWLLNNKLIGTVRLRQQRVLSTECNGEWPQMPQLCYQSFLNQEQSTKEYDWPVFNGEMYSGQGADPPTPFPNSSPPPSPPRAEIPLPQSTNPPNQGTASQLNGTSLGSDLNAALIPGENKRRLKAIESEHMAQHTRSIQTGKVQRNAPRRTVGSSTSNALRGTSLSSPTATGRGLLGTVSDKIDSRQHKRTQGTQFQRGVQGMLHDSPRWLRRQLLSSNADAIMSSVIKGEGLNPRLNRTAIDALKRNIERAGITAFKYVGAEELSGSSLVSATPEIRVYDGGGYAQDFDMSTNDVANFSYVRSRKPWV